MVKYSNVAGIETLNVLSDAHLTDEKGMTILHWALEKGFINLSVLEKLLDVIHPHVTTCDGLTPLDLAHKLRLKLRIDSCK